MRRTPIRVKLALTLAVPLLALLLRTAADIRTQARTVDDLQSQAELARAAVGPGGLINHLQNERTWAVVDLSGAGVLGVNAPVESYDESRQLADSAAAELAAEIEASDDPVAAAYADALAGLDDLAAIRADVDTGRQAPPPLGSAANTDFTERIYERYGDVILPFLEATDEIVQTIDDPDLRRGAQLVNLASRHIFQYSDMSRHMLIDGMSDKGVDTRDEIRSATASRTLWDRYGGQLLAATPPYDRVVAEHYPADFVTAFTSLSDRSLSGEEVPLDELVAPLAIVDWGGLEGFRAALSDEVNATADRIVADAQGRERTYVLTALGTMVVAALLCWLVSRSITVPLRSLTRQAKTLARERLPAAVLEVLDTPLGQDVRLAAASPVRIDARDEVGEVAEALNTVQDTALELALEQAVLRRNIADSFVTMGRRNQHLLDRQLDFITRLEAGETDPDALANLYRLDHLATRMRRNAESLLVLAGVEPPRQWSTPVNVAAVVRAALGEVEDYQRVALREVEPATVKGSVAADLAHLLAELIENALTFSSPPTQVEVVGRRHPRDGYTVAVMDTGTGMSPDALDVANRRLAGAESFTVAPSKYLGHYVAGNLAARHGINVRLLSTPGRSGTTATVELPARLLTRSDDQREREGAAGAPPLSRTV